MASIATYDSLSAADHGRELRKAVIAATVGTTIEWYDFFLYGTAAGLVFGKLYFPNSDPTTGTLLAFSTYFVGFAARPIGAAIFGHYGDRIGRKATLIATLMLMGIATFLIAFVPTYDSIGIWGGIILTVLRAIQGIGVGGEWGGSVLLSMEWTRSGQHNRGFLASWPQWGVPAGLFLSTIVMLGATAWSGDQFLVWGWRVPFILSIVLVGIGLWIRLGILETPVFQKLLAENKIEHAPIVEVMKKQPKEVCLSALLRMGQQSPFYIFTAFVFAYGVGTLHMSRDFILSAVLAASCVSFFSIPIFGHMSDRIGRKKMYLIGAVVCGLFAFLYFGMLDTGNPSAIFIAIVLSLIPHDLMYGPQAAFLSELFNTRVRYSGASLGSQLSSVIAGGLSPFIATALLPYGRVALAAYIVVMALVTIIAVLIASETSHQTIE